MNKIISFEKELNFPSMIGEITSIALDTTLKFIDSSTIKGDFIISGTYKMTEASTLEENFKYEIPTEINLNEELDIETGKVIIDNFNYEIINDDILKCNIDISVSGINLPKKEELRECDGDLLKEKEIPVKEEEIDILDNDSDSKNIYNYNNIEVIEDNNKKLKQQSITDINIEEEKEILEKIPEEKKDEKEKEDNSMKDNKDENKKISSLFEAFDFALETFSTYSVYIMRKEDTLDKVLNMYKVTKEELSDYNDLENLTVGTKLIIPVAKEDE